MELNTDSIILALALTLIAGLSTGIGSLMAFMATSTNKRFLAGAMGLSAGVMIYVSFMDLMPEAIESMSNIHQGKEGLIWVMSAFFGGIGLIALIDYLVPNDENPHEAQMVEEMERNSPHPGLRRTGTMMAIAIGVHNFPEGIATFISALDGIEVALPIVIAISIHNIPEGIAVAVPIYHATGNRRKAFVYSLMSGLAEPAGALIGIMFIIPFQNPTFNSMILAAVAGIMVYISIDELLPGSEKYGYHHLSIGGMVAGMALMAISLLLF